jgi:hypothetical protein
MVMNASFINRMVIFFIALLLFCFTISNNPTRIAVSIMSALAAGLVIWGLRTAWESREDEDVFRDSLAALKRTRNGFVERVKEFKQDVLSPFSIRRGPVNVHGPHSMADRQLELGRV